MVDYKTLLRNKMGDVGIVCPDDFQITGKFVRWAMPGYKNDACWYILRDCGNHVVGGFGDWKRNISERFNTFENRWERLTREERQQVKQAQAEINTQIIAELEAKHAEAREVAAKILGSSEKLTNHEYLNKKRVPVFGDLRLNVSYVPATGRREDWIGTIIVPLRNSNGEIESLQFIRRDGEKKFLYGGKIKGSHFVLASPEKHKGPIYIVEGYATGATVHQATGHAVICAMNSGNLPAVADAVRKRYGDRPIIIAADNDQIQNCIACEKDFNVNEHKQICPNCGKPHKKINAGLVKAREAEKICGGAMVFAQFPEQLLGQKPTDFNDVFVLSDFDLGTVRRNLFSTLPADKKPVSILLAERIFDIDSEPPPETVLITLAGKPIATVGGLSVVVAHAKAGKTAFTSAIEAAIIKPDGYEADCFGIEALNPEGKLVLHFDTEQSRADHWYCTKRVLRRAGTKRPPPWYRSYCMVGLSVDQLWQCVVEAASEGPVHTIILDGVADFVLDVNDPEETNSFIAKLMAFADLHRCHIVCVIHLNPNSDKSRGHLGSGLERKTETYLRLEKKDEITVVWSDRQRRSAITKEDGVAFRWGDDAQMHVSCNPPTEGERGRSQMYTDDDLVGPLSESGMSCKDWLEAVQIHTEQEYGKKMSYKTFHDRRRQLLKADKVHKRPGPGGLWVPVKPRGTYSNGDSK